MVRTEISLFLKNIPGIKQLMQLKDMKNMLQDGGGGLESLFGSMGGMPNMGDFGGMQQRAEAKPKKKVRIFNKASRDKKKKLSAKSRKKNRKKKK